MIKKIGGAFSLLDSEKYIYSSILDYSIFFPKKINGSNVNFFETGVDSLAYIVKQICTSNNIGEIYFPFHYCQNSIDRFKLKVKEIKIKRYKSIECLAIKKPAILLWNHFNRFQEINKNLIDSNLILIEDFVHAPYDIHKSTSNYSFNSLRKVCNLDVSVCYSLGNIMTKSSGTTEFYLKKKEAEITKFYCQKFGDNSHLETKFLDDFSKSETLLRNDKINLANELEVIKFKHINHSEIHKIRLENYKFSLSKINRFDFIEALEGEYMYLMLKCKYRNTLKKKLAAKNIFTTSHWIDSQDKAFADTLISIYIDQRYNQVDLEFVIDKIVELYEF